MHWACDRGHLNIVDLLSDNGGDINIQVSIYCTGGMILYPCGNLLGQLVSQFHLGTQI